MRKYTIILTAITTLSALPILSQAEGSPASSNASAPTCAVTQLSAIRTDFPQASQSRGEHGDVLLKISIGKDGRAIASHVTHSSGFPLLDKAASDSVIQHWRFNVADCAASELPTDSFVTVQFQRAVQQTVSGTVNTRHLAVANDKAAQSHCDSVRDPSGDQVVACLTGASLADRSVQPSLASRTIPIATSGN
jgi:TonB family protein